MGKLVLERVTDAVGLVRDEIPDNGSGCLPPSHLAEKLEDAERLSSYAAETGIKVERGIRDDILNPRIAGNVLSGLTRVAAKLRRPKMWVMVKGSLKRLEAWVVYGWTVLRDFVQVIKPARFSVLVVVAAGLLLITDQGQELTRRLDGNGTSMRETILFFACVGVWAFQSWFWARLMLDVVYGLQREVKFSHDKEREQRVARMMKHFPLLLGLGAFLVAAAALALSSLWRLTIWAVVLGFVFYLFLMRHQDSTHPMKCTRSFFAPHEGVTQYKKLKDLPSEAHFVLAISLIFAVVVTIGMIFAPDILGEWFGAAAAAFFGFALIVPAGCLVVFWSHRCAPATIKRPSGWEHFQVSQPFLLILFLWAVVLSIIVDSHAVRLAHTKDSTAPMSPAERPELPQAVKAWYDALPDNVRNSGGEIPFIIVATAGGGSRAAYWTATVLGALEDEIPGFHRYLFAISGVSGGSLGATVYRTLLKTPPNELPEQAKCQNDSSGIPRGPYECAGQQILSRDFLAPVVGSLLFPDLLQRFIPIATVTNGMQTFIPLGISVTDRAAALEMGWERAWIAAGFPADTWRGQSFTSLFKSPNESGLPALLLNGTHVATGKRIITSSFKIDNSTFLDAYDFFNLVDGDVWIATAVLNSARFTYVTPPGRMWRDGKDNGFIVDGGYFENFGAITALQLMRRTRRELEAIKKHVQPIFIQISSDPELDDSDLPNSGAPNPKNQRGDVYLNEVLSPLRAMLKTRTARGILATKQLFEKEPGLQHHFHFRLCPVDGQRNPALGWVLSSSAEENIRKGLRSDKNNCGNSDELSKLKKVVNGFVHQKDAKQDSSDLPSGGVNGGDG